MSQGDSARTHYESARRELIQRIRLRDNVLLFYLGAVGTISGVALGSSGAGMEILLVLPFLALGVATLVSQHNAVIGSLGQFCVCEIEPFLKSLPDSEYAPQWDRSEALDEYKERAITLRSWGHSVMILAPGLASLAANYRFGLGASLTYGALWWSALISMVVAIWTIRQSHRWREKNHEKMFPSVSQS